MPTYRVTLTKEEREELETIVRKGRHSSQRYRYAYVLLNCDRGEHSGEITTNSEISKVLKIGLRTIDRIKKKFVEEGFDQVLERRPSSRVYDRKADGDFEARLIALSCSKPPEGRSRWSLRLLADKMVELEVVDSVSYETVRSVLKKRFEALEMQGVGNPSPGRRGIRRRDGEGA